MNTAAAILNPPSSAPTPPDPSGSSTPTTNQPAPIPSGWWDGFKDGDLKAWAANKKYESPELLATSFRSLEQLFGAEKAGRTVMLPKDDNDAEGMKAFRAKLGVPEKPDDYKLPLPEGESGDFAKVAAGWFHQHGIPPKAAEGITKAWNDYVGKMVADGAKAEKEKSEADLQALKVEWGAEFDQNGEISRRGLREIGKAATLEDADLQKLEAAIGTSKMLRLFHQIGRQVAESSFAGGNGGGTFGDSPASAQAKLNELQAKRQKGEISDRTWSEESARLIAAITGSRAA